MRRTKLTQEIQIDFVETRSSFQLLAHRGVDLQINQSYDVLRQTRARLLHFLEKQGLANPAHVQAVPPAASAFFTAIAEQTQKADELMKQRNAANSPMLKVQLFEKALARTDEIQGLQRQLADQIRAIEEEIKQLDARWISERTDAIFPQVQAAAATLGFLERWQAQLQQRLAALAF